MKKITSSKYVFLLLVKHHLLNNVYLSSGSYPRLKSLREVDKWSSQEVQHRNPDGLSRRPCDGKGCLCTSLQSKEQVSVSSQTDKLIGKISVLTESVEGNPEVTEDTEGRLWDVAEMKAAQVEDSSVGPVYKFVEGR